MCAMQQNPCHDARVIAIFAVSPMKHRRKIEPMFGPIRKLRSAVQRLSSYDPERAYLDEATDLVDLEHRQREIDHGKFRKRAYGPY